jgi:spoIIIJ-associated protein
MQAATAPSVRQRSVPAGLAQPVCVIINPSVMEDKKRGLDDLLSDLGIGENEAPPKVVPKTPQASPVAPEQHSPKDALEHFMVGLLLRLDPSYVVDVRQEDTLFYVDIRGGDPGRLIGREGKTLQSLEFIANVTLAKQFGHEFRVLMDANGYRQRNEERIQRLAADVVEQVEASGEPVALPPMRASERRTVHVMFKEHQKVTTQSVGEGEERHVVIVPRTAELPTTPE